MSTDYDPIAEQYQRAKQQPWRTHVESFTLMDLIGDPRGLSVIDLACGEGFYTRRLRQGGAQRAVGVDLSARMIELAREQEQRQQLGIEYLVADARSLDHADQADLVVAAYLLNYARNVAELQAMCDSIARCLRPGGRFVTVNSSPRLHFPSAPSYHKYGFETRAAAPWQEEAAIQWIFHLSGGAIEVENYHHNVASHETCLQRAGFQSLRWVSPRISPEAVEREAEGYWQDFLNHPPVIFLECLKAG